MKNLNNIATLSYSYEYVYEYENIRSWTPMCLS